MEVKSRPHVCQFNIKYILNKYMRSALLFTSSGHLEMKITFYVYEKINFKIQYMIPYNEIIFIIYWLCLYNSSINKCTSSVLNLIFMFPCIVNIIPDYNQQDATFIDLFISTDALHVSGGSFAHHQEHITVHTASGIVNQHCTSCCRG